MNIIEVANSVKSFEKWWYTCDKTAKGPPEQMKSITKAAWNHQQKTIDALEKQLESARGIIEFYSDENNWSYYDMHSWSSGDSTPRSDTECLSGAGSIGSKSYGGKRARQWQKENPKGK